MDEAIRKRVIVTQRYYSNPKVRFLTLGFFEPKDSISAFFFRLNNGSFQILPNIFCGFIKWIVLFSSAADAFEKKPEKEKSSESSSSAVSAQVYRKIQSPHQRNRGVDTNGTSHYISFGQSTNLFRYNFSAQSSCIR